MAQLASLADETPEGRSIVVLAKEYGLRGRDLHEFPNAHFVPFTAKTRMSGVDIDGRHYRKGAADAVREFVGQSLPKEVEGEIERIGFLGGTPLVVAEPGKGLWHHLPQGHCQRRPARTALNASGPWGSRPS